MRVPVSTFLKSYVAAAVMCGLLSGCGGTYDSTVHGVVKLDGNPVPRGTVTFSPSGGSGSTAYGLIQSDGSYQLRTGREEGLPPGQYAVTVAANEAPVVAESNGGPPPTGKPITPEWYRSPATSGLSFAVESGDNEINLDLNRTPPEGWKPTPQRR